MAAVARRFPDQRRPGRSSTALRGWAPRRSRCAGERAGARAVRPAPRGGSPDPTQERGPGSRASELAAAARGDRRSPKGEAGWRKLAPPGGAPGTRRFEPPAPPWRASRQRAPSAIHGEQAAPLREGRGPRGGPSGRRGPPRASSARRRRGRKRPSAPGITAPDTGLGSRARRRPGRARSTEPPRAPLRHGERLRYAPPPSRGRRSRGEAAGRIPGDHGLASRPGRAPIRRVERAIEGHGAGRRPSSPGPPASLRDPSLKSALLALAGFDAGSGLPYSRAPLRGSVLPSPRAPGSPRRLGVGNRSAARSPIPAARSKASEFVGSRPRPERYS